MSFPRLFYNFNTISRKKIAILRFQRKSPFLVCYPAPRVEGELPKKEEKIVSLPMTRRRHAGSNHF